MRTKPANILPGCPYCNEDHNPDIECRMLAAAAPTLRRKPVQRAKPELVKSTDGKIIAVKHV